MGQWVGAQGWPKVTKISTCPHCDITSRNPPPKNIFFRFWLQDLLNP